MADHSTGDSSMQKFTRALTREIEVGGERLAVTLDAEGLTVRPVGSRRAPHVLSWAACVCAVAGQFASEDPPLDAEMAEAIKAIKAGAPKEVPEAAPAAPAHPGAPIPAHEQSAPVSSSPPPPARAETSVPSLLARVDRWLAAHRERFHRGLLPGASESDLAALKEAVGASVPEELASLLHWHNGQSADVPGAFEETWNLLSTSEIAKAKKELEAQASTGWIPFADNDNGSYLVIDTAQAGHPVRSFWKGNPAHDIVAPSLAAWLQGFVAALEAGKYHEDPERGSFHRAH
jgi:cell wall assembly regulator SMI1